MKRRSVSDPINITPLSAKDFEKKYADRKRVGKTARDKAKGKNK